MQFLLNFLYNTTLLVLIEDKPANWALNLPTYNHLRDYFNLL